MTLHITDPLTDDRWNDLLRHHPMASAFHQRGWLHALSRTYGYEPLVLTSTPPGPPLHDGIVLCRVSSWITGTRLVSLPFADHCEPLLGDPGDLPEFTAWLTEESKGKRHKYFEMRPLFPRDASCGMQPSRSYYFHTLDLRPGLEQLFRDLHKDSIQRKIRRAKRENLSYEVGSSERLLQDFYRLVLMTRKRLKTLPQPRSWFTNLLRYMGANLEIRVARHDGAAIAALLSLGHGSSVIYKYGCSDKRFHNLGAMPFLFWKLIEESKAAGATQLDFGRTDLGNEGLSTFKNRFGTTRRLLTYYRYPGPEKADSAMNSRSMQQLFSLLPDAVSYAAGRVLYRHMG